MKQFVFLMLILPVLALSERDLCQLSACSCHSNVHQPDFTDVRCKCTEQESFKIGPGDSDGYLIPSSSAQLMVEDCGDVELLARALNQASYLKNLTLTKSQRVTIHSKIFEARSGNGGLSRNINNIELSGIRHLEVSRHAFEGLSIEGSFMLRDVVMRTVVSLAFKFDFVREFSILGSLFDRTSMWGFKSEKCGEFNILGGSRFYSLASHAFHMKCNKFMLAYNIFDSLQDASISVMYRLADIQGNSFEKLSGKPFSELKPLSAQESSHIGDFHAPPGFVFRENKFSLDPNLPFNSLAMPGYSEVNLDAAYVDIDSNHFLCDCDRMGWYLAFVQYDFDADTLKKTSGRGTLDFMRQLYETSGFCLKCGLRSCEPSDETVVEFGQSALNPSPSESGLYSCAASGQIIKSQAEELPVTYHRTTTSTSTTTTMPMTTTTTTTTTTTATTTRSTHTPRHNDFHGHDDHDKPIKHDHENPMKHHHDTKGEEEDLAELKNLELSNAERLFSKVQFVVVTVFLVLIPVQLL